MRIAIHTASLSADVRTALRIAKSLGVHGVQLAVVGTELDPRSLGQSGRAELRAALGSLGLAPASVCADVGSLTDSAKVDEHVHRAFAVLDLARDLNAPVVTARIGRIPGNEDNPTYGVVRGALHELGEYAASRGCLYAIDTAAEEAGVLVRALDDAKSGALALNFNPGERCRHGLAPLEGWERIRTRIAHVQVTDAVPDAHSDDPEPELGRGEANLDACIAALREAGYEGHLTLRFRHTPSAEARAARGVDFLARHGGVQTSMTIHTPSRPSITLLSD